MILYTVSGNISTVKNKPSYVLAPIVAVFRSILLVVYEVHLINSGNQYIASNKFNELPESYDIIVINNHKYNFCHL